MKLPSFLALLLTIVLPISSQAYTLPDSLYYPERLDSDVLHDALNGTTYDFDHLPHQTLATHPFLNDNETAVAAVFDEIASRVIRREADFIKAHPPVVTSYTYLKLVDFGGFFFFLVPETYHVARLAPGTLAAAYKGRDAGVLEVPFSPIFLPQALDQFSPEQLTAMQELAVSTAGEQALAIQGRLADIRAGAVGFSAGPNIATIGNTYSSRPSDISLGLLDSKDVSKKSIIPMKETPDRWGFFIDGYGDMVDVDTTPEARGYRFNEGSVTVGGDYRFSDCFAAGVMAGYAGTSISLATPGDRISVDGAQANLYATWSHESLYINVIGGGGYNSYSTHNHVGFAPVFGNTEGSYGTGVLGAGYDFHAGPVTIGPVASLQYTHAGVDAFDESWSGSPTTSLDSSLTGADHRSASKLINPLLHVSPEDVDSLKSSLGGAASMTFACRKIVFHPNLSLAWQHEALDRQYSIDADFPFAAQDPFTVHGPSLGRDTLLMDINLSVQLSANLSFYGSYDGQYARINYTSHTFGGGLRVQF